jgi:hypothetical protein
LSLQLHPLQAAIPEDDLVNMMQQILITVVNQVQHGILLCWELAVGAGSKLTSLLFEPGIGCMRI